VIRVVAFDLDDTLYPERDYVLGGFKAVSELIGKRLGIKDFYPELVKTFNRGEREKTFDAALEKLGIKPNKALIQDMVNHHRAHFPNIKPYADAVPTLKYLRQKHHLALITDGYLQSQKNKVRALNIEHLFERIIYTDEYGEDYWKPSSLPYKLVMEYFSAEGIECAYVGDNIKKDFIAPNKMGWLTIQIRREGGQHLNDIDNDKFKPQVRIDSLEDLKIILKGK